MLTPQELHTCPAAEQESLGRTFTKRGGHQLRGAREDLGAAESTLGTEYTSLVKVLAGSTY